MGLGSMVAEFPRKRGKAQRKPRRTSGQEERFLSTEEAIKALGAAVVHQKRRELAKRKKALARRVPSSSWMDSAWDSTDQFPPPWDHPRIRPLEEPPATAMKTCRLCRRETPPQCVGSSGHCDDCRLASMSAHALSLLPPSPGVIDMARLKKNARAGRDYHG
jgi:hypothetical protein